MFGCSLKQPFFPKLLIRRSRDDSHSSALTSGPSIPTSREKALHDLTEYESIKAKHAQNLQDLLDIV